MMLGVLGGMRVLGLPGNPVSAYVCSVLFVAPLIRKLLGHSDIANLLMQGVLGRDLPANDELKESGIPPSFDEMKDALDLRSKSGIHRLITALEERGFIRRLPNRARAIEVIKLPEPVSQGIGRRGFTPSVIEGNLGRVRANSE